MDQPTNTPNQPINKKTGPVPIFILVLFVLLVVGGLSYILLSGKWVASNENTTNGNTNAALNTNAATTNSAAATTNQLLGGDRDEHGCIGSAGYSWCEAKQKCLRTWEEPCTLENSNSASNTNE
ncbi:MAG: hypothetical protein PHY34_04880 [Patescibacteria group bacterium]|nr:hypothetical protein [Patescibacteria group bacterium]MDD5715598.1 hypothetical protein [Patescibacteria group bacterium]